MKAHIGLLVFATIALALLAYITFPEPWLGFDDSSHIVGKYYRFDGWRRDVEATGGWCGKGCTVGAASISECRPLTQIPKRYSGSD